MKKAGFIFAGIFVVILLVVVAIPLFFKDSVRETALKTINNQIQAEVEFADFKLSVFKAFPKVSVEMTGVLVKGITEFENDTLAQIPVLKSKINLFSLFKKSGMAINELLLENPQLYLLVTESGKANWDISKPAEKSAEVSSSASSTPKSEDTFQLNLDEVQIKNGKFIYTDIPGKLVVASDNINILINGKMYGSSANLQIKGVLAHFLTEYNGVNYLSDIKFETTTLLQMDYERMSFSFLENELLVNNLPLQIDGGFQMPSDSIYFDLKLKSTESGFDNFLAILPEDYQHYFAYFETQGNASISGQIKGIYFEEEYPAFDIKMDVNNGRLKYKDLPEEISKINAQIQISKKQGNLNFTQINIKEAHAQVKNNPVDFTLKMNNVMEDPFFDGAFIGKVNFTDLKQALPFDSVNIAGLVDANLFVKGNYSSVENENYDKLNASGVVLLRNFVYDSPEFTQQIMVSQGDLNFSPQSVDLTRFNVNIGNSAFQLNGKVSNYLNYMFKKSVLKGELNLQSSFVSLNELLLLQKKEEKILTENQSETTKTKSDTIQNVEPQNLAFQIPENIDFTFKSSIKKARLNQIDISDINGLITAKQGVLWLNGLNMKMLDGELALSGSYKNNPENQPFFDFKFNVLDLDIPAAYQSLTGFRKMMPGAENSTGKINSGFQLAGRLNSGLSVFPASLNGNGFFKSENLQIINSPIFKQLDGILKAEKLQNVKVNDFIANFNVENGNLLLRPFETKIAGQETKIEGSLNAQNLLNMRLDFNIERDAFGADIQSILSALPGNKKLTKVPAGVLINGPVGNPEVKMDLSETRKTITNAAKDGMQDSLDKIGKGLLKLFEK